MKEKTVYLGETNFPKPQINITQFGELVKGFLGSFFEWFGELGSFVYDWSGRHSPLRTKAEN